MDARKRQLLEQNLAAAERHVVEGERLLEKQRASIEQRRLDGFDVELATQLLNEMEYTQRMHIADRDRLRRECRPSGRV